MSWFIVETAADDVEEVMAATADALRRWEAGEDGRVNPGNLPLADERWRQQAQQLRFQWRIDSQAVIHSTRPHLGPWIVRFQHLVRRLTWWFLEPILLQVRLFQQNTAAVIEGLAREQALLAAQIARLEAEVTDLRGRLGESGERDD
ncbi:MAG: hypothetical protein JW900_02280 [Anaerolineae bacterium]|nr:hypothetical protein [Anaerolineae bacterium]